MLLFDFRYQPEKHDVWLLYAANAHGVTDWDKALAAHPPIGSSSSSEQPPEKKVKTEHKAAAAAKKLYAADDWPLSARNRVALTRRFEQVVERLSHSLPRSLWGKQQQHLLLQQSQQSQQMKPGLSSYNALTASRRRKPHSRADQRKSERALNVSKFTDSAGGNCAKRNSKQRERENENEPETRVYFLPPASITALPTGCTLGDRLFKRLLPGLGLGQNSGSGSSNSGSSAQSSRGKQWTNELPRGQVARVLRLPNEQPLLPVRYCSLILTESLNVNASQLELAGGLVLYSLGSLEHERVLCTPEFLLPIGFKTVSC